MKISLLLLFVLVGYWCTHFVSSQTIIQSPQNQSACEGETVNFVCVIMFPDGSTPVRPLWFDINGNNAIQPPDVTATDDSNGRSAPANVISVLTVTNVSISDNGDNYICGLGGLNPISSNISFLTVHAAAPMTAPNITGITPLSNTSFIVNWTITDPDHIYIMTLINMSSDRMDSMSMTVTGSTSIHMATGLDGDSNYTVSVTANNSCGMMMNDSVTVYDIQNAVPMGVIVPEEHITSESFVVQWDRVSNYTGNYTVRWYGEDGSSGVITVNGTSYNVTGLTANTFYNVTVAVYTCLGAGRFSNIVMTVTNNLPPTSPLTTPIPGASDGGGGGDNTGLIIGVVIGVIVILAIIVIIIIVVFCYIKKKKGSIDSSNKQELKSPTSTSGGHTASVQPASSIVPHQAAASGEEYALTTKVVTKPQQQQATEEYAVMDKNKKHATAAQGIHYAELQALPSSEDKPPPNQGPTSTITMVA